MALMTTSGSMPFSLASASIVCCNGFDIISLEFHFQIRPRDHAERHPVPPSVLAVDQHVVPPSTPASAPLKNLWPSTGSRITIFARRPANRR